MNFMKINRQMCMAVMFLCVFGGLSQAAPKDTSDNAFSFVSALVDVLQECDQGYQLMKGHGAETEPAILLRNLHGIEIHLENAENLIKPFLIGSDSYIGSVAEMVLRSLQNLKLVYISVLEVANGKKTFETVTERAKYFEGLGVLMGDAWRRLAETILSVKYVVMEPSLETLPKGKIDYRLPERARKRLVAKIDRAFVGLLPPESPRPQPVSVPAVTPATVPVSSSTVAPVTAPAPVSSTAPAVVQGPILSTSTPSVQGAVASTTTVSVEKSTALPVVQESVAPETKPEASEPVAAAPAPVSPDIAVSPPLEPVIQAVVYLKKILKATLHEELP